MVFNFITEGSLNFFGYGAAQICIIKYLSPVIFFFSLGTVNLKKRMPLLDSKRIHQLLYYFMLLTNFVCLMLQL